MVHVLVVLALVLALALAWQGWRLGLLRRVLEFAGVLFGLYFATAQADGLGAALVRWTGLEGRALLYVGWIALFLIVLLITRLVAALTARAVQVSLVGWIDQGGGALFGLLIGLLMASALLNVAARMSDDPQRRASYERHPVAGPLLGFAGLFIGEFRQMGDAPGRVWDEMRTGARRAATSASRAAERVLPDHTGEADSVAAHATDPEGE